MVWLETDSVIYFFTKISNGAKDLYSFTEIAQKLVWSLFTLKVTPPVLSTPTSWIIIKQLSLVNPCGYGIGIHVFTSCEKVNLIVLIRLFTIKLKIIFYAYILNNVIVTSKGILCLTLLILNIGTTSPFSICHLLKIAKYIFSGDKGLFMPSKPAWI